MRRLIGFLAISLLFYSNLFAQVFRFGVPNLEDYDMGRFHYGFSLGIDIVDVNLKTKTDYEHPNISLPDFEVKKIYSKPMPAFSVGILVNMRMGRFFDLRFIPNFSIAHDIDLYYQFAQTILDPNSKNNDFNDLILRKIECHYINFPLLIKFKSSRMHNVRIFALTGGQVGINMMSAKNNKIPVFDPDGVLVEILPILKPYDVQVQGGFGFDFYTTYFKFSAEFKISYGVINMLQNESGIKDKDHIPYYNKSPIITGLQSIKSKTFTISFIVE
ncbi:MAG: PorT family protein [Lentimicrobiaceae bacterium]|nr:PorT family protein [Lentimicrobiaceae bacterium]